MIRVFVGSNDRWADHEPVLQYSIEKHASEQVDVTFVRPGAFGMLETGCTTFTNVRYAVPELAGYRGFAIYLDVDMLVLADVAELIQYRRYGKWVRLADGADEVSVIDCRIRALPRKEQLHMFQKWHLRQMIAEQSLDMIPADWNSEDQVRPGMKLLHFTDLKCQPWFGEHPCRPAVQLLQQYNEEARENDYTPRPPMGMAGR